MLAHAAEKPSEPFGHHLFGRREHLPHQSYYHWSRTSAWQPAVNLYEDERAYYLCAELAGLEKDEIRVDALEQNIRIRGDRPVPVPCDQLNPEAILRIEIDSGPFERSIELPMDAEMNSAEARLDQGYLWITVNKRR